MTYGFLSLQRSDDSGKIRTDSGRALFDFLSVIPVPSEPLPPEIREKLQSYLRSHPIGFAVKAKPEAGRKRTKRATVRGREKQKRRISAEWACPGALESWEANYREARSAQQ